MIIPRGDLYLFTIVTRCFWPKPAVLDAVPASCRSDNEFPVARPPNTYYSFGTWADE